MNKVTKESYVNFLNEVGTPDDDKKSNGGRVPDNCKYGSWLRRNDPIAFSVGYREKVKEFTMNIKLS